MDVYKRAPSACNICFCFIRGQQKSMMPNPNRSQVKFPQMRMNKLDKLLHVNNRSPQVDEVFSTPNGDVVDAPNFTPNGKITGKNGDVLQNDSLDVTEYHTPKGYQSQISQVSSSSVEEYTTPNGSISGAELSPRFVELKKSCSCSVVEHKNMSTIAEHDGDVSERNEMTKKNNAVALDERLGTKGVLRSKSNFEITRVSPTFKSDSVFQRIGQKSDSLLAFLTPHLKRKNAASFHSTPKNPSPTSSLFRVPSSPIQKRHLRSLPETRATSLSSLKSGFSGMEGQQFQQVER